MNKAPLILLLISICAQGFTKEAVVTAHPLATKAGLEILEKGGNAFDAAVAVAATLTVVEPAMTSLGGYGTTLIYDAKEKEIRYLNSCGKFPINANSDLMRSPTKNYLENRQGPKSITTPGMLHGWEEMHTAYGKLEWNELFDSAIKYAKNGFPLSPYIAKLIGLFYNDFSDYTKSFYGKNGIPLQVGETLIQKDLANTYETITKEGPHPFYHGQVAHQIDKQMQEMGSFLSIEDLRTDKAQWWDPVKVTFKGHDIYTIGIPSNGYISLLILRMMELTDSEHNSTQYLHTLAKALKKSSQVRLQLPGTFENKEHIENQISQPDGKDTTHYVAIDKWGNIVCSTETLGQGFGSKIMIEGTGIWMNNAMAFSTFEPKGNPMDVTPGGYKISSNAPIIIMKDNQPYAALGTPGGHTIPQNIAQVIINMLHFNMGIQEAINAPKLAYSAEDDVTCTEEGIPQERVTSLENLGHTIANDQKTKYLSLNGTIGNVMGAKIGTDEHFELGIDHRKDAWSKLY